VLAGESVRIAWAIRLGGSSQMAAVKRAVSLDPANPELHFRLGTAEVYDLEHSDPAEGLQQLRLATELSPHEARYWSALASACQFEGKMGCASGATARTLALSPMAPHIHWEAANYYLWSNHQELAIGQFRRLLELDTNYAGATFRASLRALGDPGLVYSEVLPPASSPKLKLAYISFLSSHGNGDFAFQVWEKLVASKSVFDFSAADPYLEHLIGARKYQEALSAWGDLEARGLVPQSGGNGGLVFNGGFEHVPMNAGFDWRYQQDPYVAIDFQGGRPYEGKHSLQLDFSDVENHLDEPVYQIVPVKSDQTYVLSAQVRSNSLTAGSGPRLRVTDPACSECLTASSDAVIGTTSWHEISLTFRTGPQTTAVRVSVWRARSLGYPTEILGTLWVDQVSLRPVASVPAQITQRGGTS
jgi:Carbohydrate binding domain